MASRLIFDPIVALRAAPLISSTCTLLFAWDQHFFLGILNREENRPHQSRALLPSYFRYFFSRGLVMVLGFITASASAGVANLYVDRAGLRARGGFSWYVAGASLAAGHLLFAPVVAPSVQRIVEADEKTDVHGTLQRWRVVNMARMLTVDLAAWVAFCVATGRTLRV